MKSVITKSQKGSVIIYAVLTMSVMLAISLTLTSLFISKFKAAAAQRDSVIALYAADSATELCLYEARTNKNDPPLLMDNKATFTIDSGAQKGITDCSTLGSASFGFRATGAYRGSKRTLEISQ
jgi:hypothetical protein